MFWSQCAIPGFLKIAKGVPTPKAHAFDARFYLHDPADATGPAIHYSAELMRRFSPQNLSLMEFRPESDHELCAKVRGEQPLLVELGYQFRRELHAADDAHFFKKLGPQTPPDGSLRLFEGKRVFQFDDQFAPATYYVVDKEAREELLRNEIYRLTQFIRSSEVQKLEGADLPRSKGELEKQVRDIFLRKRQASVRLRKTGLSTGREFDKRTDSD
jgi:hypothetical protein